VLRIRCCFVAGTIVIGALAAEPAAAQDPLGPLLPASADMSLTVKGAKDGDVKVHRRANIIGSLKPFVPGQEVDILLERGDKTIRKLEDVAVTQVGTSDEGTFSMRSPRLVEPGSYQATAEKEATPEQDGATAVSDKFKIDYPKLGKGRRGHEVGLFNDLLDKQGYHTSNGNKYNERTARAVMAFRKVNRMGRKWSATPGIFRKLADDKGAFNLKYPGRGHHVEVDISRQVMVLADGGKPKHTFHVSTGAPGTPSDKGNFRFYRKDPGFNSIGMYYSVYYNRGEATHGYRSVPTYPASHGCIRNPIPDSKFIYRWINLGNSMSVYR
jgi:hypothetical protein